jgi:hypothetical protein
MDAGIVGPDMPQPTPFDPQVVAMTDEERGKPKTRKRPQPVDVSEKNRPEIAQRVLRFLREDRRARERDLQLRKQRYAKLMQFEPSQSDMDGASNVQLSDILATSLKMEDQIQNSVISTRPIMNSRALADVNKERERKVDLLTDYQFFIEQNGEDLIEQLTADFFRDGQFTALTHWVREFRKIQTVRHWPPIPFGGEPKTYFKQILDQAFGDSAYRAVDDSDGWDWDVTDQGMDLRVRFYTEEDPDGVLMETSGEPEVFSGPCVLRYGYEDVLAPMWSLNLQSPGPSNPGGAPHVILVDYPTRDEIIRGVEAGYYDLISEDDLEGIEGFRDWSDGDRDLARQKHEIRGHGPTPTSGGSEEQDHRQLRRLICFDVWKGLDVVWWVLEGPDLLLRARPLTEFCPGLRPMRPVAHARCIAVQDTWIGMGIPELMESIHDFKVATYNQMVDAAALEINPFFKYRQSSNLKPEDIILGPGMGIPMQNPQTDLIFERIQAQATQVGTNLIALAQQQEERLTLVGDLQVGQIPTGKSAALRTSGGIQQVLAQGEARPERMLRRFFGGLKQIFTHMYQLDRHFLTDEKKFRALGELLQPKEDPIIVIDRAADLGDTHFEFGANVLNSSKVALQASLQEMMTILGNPLMFQMGITTPDGFFRLLRDYTQSLGQNGEKYMSPPTPMASNPPILAAEALTMIMNGQPPMGPPAEGDFEAHIQALMQALSAPGGDGIPLSEALSSSERQAVALYVQSLQQQAMQAEQQFQMMQAAQQFQDSQQQQGGAQGGGKPKPPPTGQVSGPKEQMDEAMPMGTGTPQ